MNDEPPPDSGAHAGGHAPLPGRAVALAVGSLFLIYSAIHAPLPAAGEPHYLTKARHFVDPSWCAGDFFLESSNAHAVFYAVFGPLTTVLPFAAVAWIGRFLGLGLLAFGWTALLGRLTGTRWGPFVAAAVYILIASIGSLSGEWMLDGIEGKVIAYALLFLGWSQWLDGRPQAAGLLLGGSISFHPIVGGWGAVAACGGWITQRLKAERRLPGRETVRDFAIGFLLMLLTAAPGVAAAMTALTGEKSYSADYIQVFYRLAHHLDPTTFPTSGWVCYAAMLIGWQIARRWQSGGPGDAWWNGCVLASVLIALAGLAIAWGPRPPETMAGLEWRMRLMKFYPFRLVDVLVPMAVAVAGSRFLMAGADRCWGRISGRWALGMLLVAIIAGSLIQARETRYRPPVPLARQSEWRDVCGWIGENVPGNTVFLTPQETWAFKWFAQRPEYVSYKDCPQDAAGILEWNRRLRYLSQWAEEEWNDGFSESSLRRLRRETGITHILARDLGPFAIPPVYENAVYRVIAIPGDSTP